MGLTRLLRTDPRLVLLWQEGSHPDSGNLYSLFSLATALGHLHLLLPEVDSERVLLRWTGRTKWLLGVVNRKSR